MVDNLLRKRTGMLWFAVVGFSLWQIGILAAGWFPDRSMLTNVVQAIGMIVFGLAMLRLAQLSHATQNPKVAELLNDELTQLLRYKALYFSYLIVASVVGSLVAVSPLFVLEPEVLVRSLLVVMVAVPIGSFLWLDYRAGAEG